MGKIKRIVALMLAVLVVCTSQSVMILAEDVGPVVSGKTANEAAKGTETPMTDENTVISNVEQAEGSKSGTDDQVQVPVLDSVAMFSYVYVDEQVVNVPETQNIALAFADEATVLETAVLMQRSKITGETQMISASSIIKNTILFTKEYNEGPIEDEYTLDSLTYKIQGEGQEKTILFSDEGIEAGYQVTMSVQEKTEESVAEPEVEFTAYAIDEAGNTVEKSGDSIEKVVDTVLGEAGAKPVEDMPTDSRRSRSRSTLDARSNNVKVALSPGHDANHPGAGANGLSEYILTLKVAQYCKAELESYSGVSVYMTRNSAACPHATSSSGTCNRSRIDAAAAWGANVYVDIHFNSGGGTGAEIFYPNQSHNANIGAEGKALADAILAQLSALGLHNRGAKIRNADNGEQDGSGNLADYYTTNNYCKAKGIPGIIVEHAFLDNSADAGKLKNESFIKSLGVADATGIAKKYGLVKGGSKPQISIANRNDFQGTFRVEIKGVPGVNSVRVPIWSEDNGQDDLRWYDAVNDGGGSFHVDVKTSNHKNSTGKYYAEAYTDGVWKCGTTFTITKASAAISVKAVGSNQMQYLLSTQITKMPSDLKGVRYAVWSDKGGQDDLRWYDAVKSGNIWENTINISDFKTDGRYQVHVYATLSNGFQAILGTKEFQVSGLSVSSFKGENYNQANGTFDVVISGITSPSGVKQIQVPIWCASNQSDIVWYTATKQSTGAYKVNVNIANHKYSTGIYKMHMYATAGNGIQTYGAAEYAVALPDIKVSASDTSKNETKYGLNATNVGRLGNVKGVSFAVWSVERGQDDILWYGASQNGQGAWNSTADINRHKTAGKYEVHTYAAMADGALKFIGQTSFNVSKVAVQSFQVKNYNKTNGTFDVVISGFSSVSGMAQIQVPVWCAENQSDIVWYTATKQSNGEYKVNVSIANHKYATGIYKMHLYATAGNGIQAYGSIKHAVELPDIKVSASDTSKNETKYGLNATNVGRLGNVKGVSFAVWSVERGQDDILWYGASQNGQGAWNSTADINRHKTAGKYEVHAYATMADGALKFIGQTSFNVSKVAVQSFQVKNYNKTNGTFDVVISGFSSVSGMAQIQVPVWCAENQSDIVWYTATKQSNGEYKVNVSIANHKYATGIYKMHLYATAGNGIQAYGSIKYAVELPDIKVSASDTSKNETKYGLNATNVGRLGNIKGVSFAVWNIAAGQDDMLWYSASQNGQGAWGATADINRHKTAGKYEVHAYATMADGSLKFVGNTWFNVSTPKGVVSVQNYNSTRGTFDVFITDINTPSGAAQVQVPVWSAGNQSDIKWYMASRQSNGSYKVTVDARFHENHSGTYQIHVYLTSGNGITSLIDAKTQIVKVLDLYPIMGTTMTTVEQMTKYFTASGSQYPAQELAKGGAGDLRTFCQIFYEEARAEGVRAEVAFTQSMKETGWLKFGGMITINQFNFCGLGATDVNGQINKASFVDVRTGIRAQIQHLKAYASADALNNACVDPRFGLVKRNCAPYVQWLGQKENPGGCGWATSEKYGYDIASMINNLKNVR